MPILKQIKTDSTRNTDDYLDREKEGSDLPRVLYEGSQHCRPATAKSEFRALREEHGRQGETRTVPAKYVVPEDLAEATHLKVGKNWREARKNETATHRRIEPRVPIEKRPEGFHDIISFGPDEVNREDPEQCLKAFEFTAAYFEKHHHGEQIKLVAHGDAEGSTRAQEKGEDGKFHVHVLRNAVIHSEMEVDGRVFEPGMRAAGPLTHIDTRRDKLDDFLLERGREFGLGPQKLPRSRSKEATAVRRTDQDFFEAERGKISDHDRARRGMETAFAALSKDSGDVAGLGQAERMRRLADEVKATGDAELKLRKTKTGDVRIRSFQVPGRRQAIGSTKLGGRYDNDGVAEQLELITAGQWKPHVRPQAGPAKKIEELPYADISVLQNEADALALEEQQEVELDRWLADWAAEDNISVDDLWARQGMTGTPAERELAHGWKSDWDKEQAARTEAAEKLAPVEADRDRAAVRETSLPAVAAASNPQSDSTTSSSKPTVKREERQLGVLAGEQMKDVELIAVVHRERADGGAYVDFQINAEEPAAQDQPGLHMLAQKQERADGQVITKTWRQLKPDQYNKLLAAAGDNQTTVGDTTVLGVRATIGPVGRGYSVDTNSMRASDREPVGPAVIERQRLAEDSARTPERTQARHEATKKRVSDRAAELDHAEPTPSASDRFSAKAAAATQRDRSTTGRGL